MKVLLALVMPAMLAAQQPTPPPAPPPATPPVTAPALAPAADSQDVSSVDAILSALYQVISGDSGVARNWNRFRSLFAPGARLIPIGPRPGGAFGTRVLTPEEYIQLSGPFLVNNGFHEREVAHRSERYGQLVHVFSTYESRRRATDPAPFARGINSIQLFHDGQRWWVMTVMWRQESRDLPLTARYLESERH
jgi:hypothetical protein